jgi:hypothetical protein
MSVKEVKSQEKLTAVVSPAVEKLSVEDKHLLDMEKMRKDMALTNAKMADTAYNNVVLQLALKYKLIEGDRISDDGEIVRKTNAKAE